MGKSIGGGSVKLSDLMIDIDYTTMSVRDREIADYERTKIVYEDDHVLILRENIGFAVMNKSGIDKIKLAIR